MIIEITIGLIVSVWCLSQQKQINRLKNRCEKLEDVLSGEVELKQLTEGKIENTQISESVIEGLNLTSR